MLSYERGEACQPGVAVSSWLWVRTTPCAAWVLAVLWSPGRFVRNVGPRARARALESGQQLVLWRARQTASGEGAARWAALCTFPGMGCWARRSEAGRRMSGATAQARSDGESELGQKWKEGEEETSHRNIRKVYFAAPQAPPGCCVRKRDHLGVPPPGFLLSNRLMPHTETGSTACL